MLDYSPRAQTCEWIPFQNERSGGRKRQPQWLHNYASRTTISHTHPCLAGACCFLFCCPAQSSSDGKKTAGMMTYWFAVARFSFGLERVVLNSRLVPVVAAVTGGICATMGLPMPQDGHHRIGRQRSANDDGMRWRILPFLRKEAP